MPRNYRKSIQQQRARPALGEGLCDGRGRGVASAGAGSCAVQSQAIAQLLDDMRDATEAMRDRWFARPAWPSLSILRLNSSA
jgi:hypothetical protein